MAYLAPHFDPDVFVSYSHGKSGSDGKSPLRDWTRALLRERLEAHIHNLSADFDDLSLYMDDKIDPTAHLTAELRTKVSGSGVLIIVMSERYLKSSWCQDELEWFRKQIRDRAGDPGRVFVIRAQTTDTSQWPDFLCDEHGHPLIGFTFHDPNGDPLGWPNPREDDEEFWKALTGLRTRVDETVAGIARSGPTTLACGDRPMVIGDGVGLAAGLSPLAAGERGCADGYQACAVQ
jgi:hypothetical protein